jgi:hypothetical protein
MALQLPLFPIDQPVMPETRQIGRRAAIEGLTQGVEAVTHQWLIGERRIGKTSVAKATLARLRAKGTIALDLDLSKLEIRGPADLAREIAWQAQAAQVGAPNARKGPRFLKGRGQEVRGVGNVLKAAGYDEVGEALSAVSAFLAGADEGTPELGEALEALALHARATESHVVVLFDEVHLLAQFPGAEADLARWCREPDSPVVFVFAGSEETAVRALRDDGRPLAAIGQEFSLPSIEYAEWLPGLRDRFAEAGVEIGEGQIYKIISVADGHPRRTMLIASHVHLAALAQPTHRATEALVELAIGDAKRDRSWT